MRGVYKGGSQHKTCAAGVRGEQICRDDFMKNPSCMNISVHTGGISSCVMIVGILMTVSKQDQICFEMPLLPVFTGKNGGCSLFPLVGSTQNLNIFVWVL